MNRRRIMMAQTASALPSGYKQLEYIKNGTESYCLLPTNLYYQKPADSIEIVCMFEDDNNVRACMVGEYGQEGYLSMGRKGNNFWGYFSSKGTFDWQNYYIPNQTKHIISVFGNSVYVNNNLIFTGTQAGQKYQFRLFGVVNPSTDPVTGVLRIYSCRLIIDGVEHFLIPVQRKADGIYGMFNTTTKEFYTNAGNGIILGV